MSIQQFWKGLLMILISIVVTGLGQVPIDVALLFVAGISAVLGYVGKNLIFVIPDVGSKVWPSLVSGLLVALGTGITEYIGLIVVEHKMIWPVFLKVVGSVLFTYLGSTLFAPPSVKSKPIGQIKLFKKAA